MSDSFRELIKNLYQASLISSQKGGRIKQRKMSPFDETSDDTDVIVEDIETSTPLPDDLEDEIMEPKKKNKKIKKPIEAKKDKENSSELSRTESETNVLPFFKSESSGDYQ
jgi:hypothetical protein